MVSNMANSYDDRKVIMFNLEFLFGNELKYINLNITRKGLGK